MLQFGFIGAPLAQAFGAWFNLLLTLWYVRHKGLHEKCWGGWDSECLHGWGTMARLGMAGMASTMGQWWSWEICAGCAGVLGKIQLAAHSCITNIGFFCEPQAHSFQLTCPQPFRFCPLTASPFALSHPFVVPSHPAAASDFPVPFSVGLATTIRIGNLLGEGNAAAAKVSGRAGACIILSFIACLIATILVERNNIPYLCARAPLALATLGASSA